MVWHIWGSVRVFAFQYRVTEDVSLLVLTSGSRSVSSFISRQRERERDGEKMEARLHKFVNYMQGYLKWPSD